MESVCFYLVGNMHISSLLLGCCPSTSLYSDPLLVPSTTFHSLQSLVPVSLCDLCMNKVDNKWSYFSREVGVVTLSLWRRGLWHQMWMFSLIFLQLLTPWEWFDLFLVKSRDWFSSSVLKQLMASVSEVHSVSSLISFDICNVPHSWFMSWIIAFPSNIILNVR